MRSPLWASSQWSPLSAVSPPANKICPSQCSLHGENACAYCRDRLLPFLIARNTSLFRHISQSQSFLICSNSQRQVRKLTELQKSTSRLVALQKNLTGMGHIPICLSRVKRRTKPTLTPTKTSFRAQKFLGWQPISAPRFNPSIDRRNFSARDTELSQAHIRI